jgi:hypothetical protein
MLDRIIVYNPALILAACGPSFFISKPNDAPP